MKIAICIDKSGGTLFNNRRLSQDSVLRQQLLEIVGDNKLYLNKYSAKQFEDQSKLEISENFLDTASEDDLCFVENAEVDIAKVSQVYLFHWNRAYPADTFFEFDAKALNFKKIQTKDFVGSSHKKITLEVYIRK
ncbi:MAG: ribonuclease Z [Clostridia bacterium]|nr:ribonuclease Z [Clostridia bacterium]